LALPDCPATGAVAWTSLLRFLPNFFLVTAAVVVAGGAVVAEEDCCTELMLN
jgi:hypothetical protein